MNTYETVAYSLYTNTEDLSYKNGIIYPNVGDVMRGKY